MNTALHDETLELRARYDEEPSHSDHVAALAVQLFDELKPWHQLEPRLHDLLHCAAILHDIGWSQTADGGGHHKHSARLIQQHEWKTLQPGEVALVAQVARYHRKSIPQAGHDDFHALSESAQRHVMALGGMLRVADALDRTHTGKITRIEATVTEDELLLQVESRGSWDAERAMFETKRDMLELAAARCVRAKAI